MSRSPSLLPPLRGEMSRSDRGGVRPKAANLVRRRTHPPPSFPLPRSVIPALAAGISPLPFRSPLPLGEGESLPPRRRESRPPPSTTTHKTEYLFTCEPTFVIFTQNISVRRKARPCTSRRNDADAPSASTSSASRASPCAGSPNTSTSPTPPSATTCASSKATGARSPPPRPTTSCSNRCNCSTTGSRSPSGTRPSPATPSASRPSNTSAPRTPTRPDSPTSPEKSGAPPPPSSNAPNKRPDQPELYESDDEESQNPAKHTPKSSTAFHPNSTISSPGLEIVENSAPEEKISSTPTQTAQSPDQDAVIEEVLTIFPHLKGRSNQQILDFLDQFTNPNANEPEDPTPIYAAAAG